MGTRDHMWGGRSGLAWVPLAATLALGLAACGSTALPAPSGTASGSSTAHVPSATPSATELPGSLESATAVGSDQVAAIPDGVWVSDPIPAAVVKSMIDKTKLSAGEKQRALTEDFGWTASRKQLLETLTLDHGQWTESASWDGEPFSVGANGPYAFPDDHTIAMQDNVSLITYAVSGNAASVRLKMVSDSASPNDLANDVEPVIVFCTAAWHRKA